MAKPGGLALMIGLGKKKPGPDMDSEEDSGEGAESAEDEAFSAFAESLGTDNAAAKEAFKSFIEICYPSLGGSSEEYPEEEG